MHKHLLSAGLSRINNLRSAMCARGISGVRRKFTRKPVEQPNLTFSASPMFPTTSRQAIPHYRAETGGGVLWRFCG